MICPRAKSPLCTCSSSPSAFTLPVTLPRTHKLAGSDLITPTGSLGSHTIASSSTTGTLVRRYPYGLRTLGGLPSHVAITWWLHNMHHPCHLIGWPPSQWTWDLRVQPFFSFYLFLSYCMLIPLRFLHSAIHIPASRSWPEGRLYALIA